MTEPSTDPLARIAAALERLAPPLSASADPLAHPAWTGGNQRLLDQGGQVARFNKRFGGLSLKK